MIARRARRTLLLGTSVAAALGGTFAAWHYHQLDLTLTHYDARGHLVVARRIADSITPGWQQIGAVWLPLPHLLNALPVQIDFFYRTGASGVAISVASYAIATAAIAWIVATLTESIAASLAAAAVFALNPNVLYLQSTPLTEPLLLAATTVAVAMLIAWCGGTQASSPFVVGIAFTLACLTRYEAWPVTAGALVAAVWVRWRRGESALDAARAVGRVALYPALAIVGFAIVSRVVVGEWFVASGFFVPENTAVGDAWRAVKEIGWGLETLSGPMLVWIGGMGIAAAAVQAVATRRRADALIVVPLVAMAAIAAVAFYRGHPFRIRYMVPLVAAEAIGAGLVAGVIPRRRAQLVGAIALASVAAYELSPLDARAPMVIEAQWDRPNLPERSRVTACIGRLEPGAKIMASMGSLGHYMQEASASGLAIRDFLHEGNGDIWLAALERPQLFADWLLIEEKAEGGDMLAHAARERSSFLEGYQRTCEGAGLALYRRVEGKPEDPEFADGR